MAGMDPLSQQEQLFVADYLRHFNAARAARSAGYAPKSSHRQGFEMLRRAPIQHAIAEAVSQRLEKANVSAELVMREWLAVAQADPNEIVQVRRTCCRYCHGVDGRYQRTQRERDAAHTDWVMGETAWHMTPKALAGDPYPPFDEMGGVGFNPTSEPSEQCFECFGEGVASVHLTDTRDLSPGARALFAGVKQTKDGVEVKLHSKEKAWEMIAKYLGMLKDKIEVEGNIGLVERLARGRARVRGEQDGNDLAG